MKAFKAVLIVLAVILVVLVATSLFDIVVAALFFRHYTDILFAVIFGVGGIFASALAWTYAGDLLVEENTFGQRVVAAAIVVTGLLFFFLISYLEGGEYEVPFRAFGATLAAGGLFFLKTRLR